MWALAQSIYVLIGGGLALPLIGSLFAGEQASVLFGRPVSAFVVITGTILLWPMLILLAETQD